jgi:hypothetical protein
MNGKVILAGLGALAIITAVVVIIKRKASAEAVHVGREAPASGLADINGDGWVTEDDLQTIKDAYLMRITLTDDEFDRADVNQDGRIDIGDYLMAKRYLVGDIDLP